MKRSGLSAVAAAKAEAEFHDRSRGAKNMQVKICASNACPAPPSVNLVLIFPSYLVMIRESPSGKGGGRNQKMMPNDKNQPLYWCPPSR